MPKAPSQRNSVRRAIAPALLAALALAPAPALAAEMTMPMAAHAEAAPLEQLLAEARTRHPGVLAARRRYEAARARIEGEGLLPDPMVEAGVMSLTSGMGPQLTVTQTLPGGNKLELARDLAAQEAESARYAYLDALSDVLMQVKTAYFDLYALDHAQRLVEETKALVQRMGQVATAKYAVGGGLQADVTRANAQVGEMMHESVVVMQQRESASATLMGLLARPVSATHVHPVQPVVQAPGEKPFTTPIDALMAEAEAHNPALAMAKADLERAKVALAQAQQTATPDVNARVGLAQAYMGQGWQTVLSGMVGVNVPFPNGVKRERAAVSAAERSVEAAEAAVEEQRRRIRTALAADMTHVHHLAEQVRLYRTGLMPQARQTLASQLAGYQVNKSDFDAVITAQMAIYRYERETFEAIADYHKMLADIEALTGRSVAAFEEPS